MKQILNIKLLIICSIITLFLINNAPSQTYSWETPVNINYSLNTLYSYYYRYELAYDYFGLHFAGLDNNNHLHYRLINNNGELIPNYLYDNTTINVTGIGITSYNNAIYIAAIDFNGINIISKENDISSNTFQEKGYFSGGNYTFANNSEQKIVSMVGYDGYIYITWDRANYQNYPVYAAIGFARYSPGSNTMEFLDPIDYFEGYPQFNNGKYPQLAKSNDNKISIVYTKVVENNMFVVRDLDFTQPNPYDLFPQQIGNWGNNSYIDYIHTRANIQYSTANDLYLYAHLTSYSMSPLYIDSKMKIRDVYNNWSNAIDIKLNDANYEKQPYLSFNEYSNKVLLPYSDYTGGYGISKSVEYNITSGLLETPVPHLSRSLFLYQGGEVANSKKGDFIVYPNYDATNNYYKATRKPKAITGNVTENILLTGNEYFNSSSSTECHLNGNTTIAMANSVINISPNTTLILDKNASNVYSYLYLKQGSTLNIGENAELLIKGNPKHPAHFHQGSVFEIDAGVTINAGANSRIRVVDDGFVRLTHKYQNNGLRATVNCGANFSIVTENKSWFNAFDVDFYASSQWNGIYIKDAAPSEISFCSFQNATIPIRLYNDPNAIPYPTNYHIFEYNTFYVPTGNRGIDAENPMAFLIDHNTFYLSTGALGIWVRNYVAPNQYSCISIADNTFSGGTVPMALTGFNDYVYNYIVNNNVTTGSSNSRDIYGRLLTGSFEGNTLSSNASISMHFQQSSPKLLSNYTVAGGTNIDCPSSYVHMEPIQTQDEFIWESGLNRLETSSGHNISMSASYTYLENGHNIFLKNGINYNHLYGSLIISEDVPYSVINNCFNNSHQPSSELWDYYNENSIVPIWEGSTIQCIPDDDKTDKIISDKGNGIYDTIYISANNSGVKLSSDKVIYNQARYMKLKNDFGNALKDYKKLIDNYPQSAYVYASLFDLFECYQKLDVNSQKSSNDISFANLKDYLESKINSGLYPDDFVDVAFNFTLICASRIHDYKTALEGYEFTALFHPNYEIRLTATWDYDAIQSNISNGGSVSEKDFYKSDEEFISNRLSVFTDKLIDNPILKKVKQVYDKMAAKKTGKNNIKGLNDKDNERGLESNTIYNLKNMKYLTKEEKVNRQLQDLLLITKGDSPATDFVKNSIPVKYALSQNYPNPFNPVTKINYDLPRDSKVKLVIFDVLGREVKTLVNEIKSAGSYSVEFNGSQLSSGIYFYKIQAGDFVSVKKMVLVK